MSNRIVLVPAFVFFVSLIGARDQGCQAPALGTPCPAGESIDNCRCTFHDLAHTTTLCHDTTSVCAPDLATAQQRAFADIKKTGVAGIGSIAIDCACTPDGQPPAAWPQTIGGDPVPECSNVMSQGAGGSGGSTPPTCAQPADVCDTGIDCCSGQCTLNACE